MTIIEVRSLFEKINANRYFEFFVISVIILSALLVGAKTYSLDPNVQTVLGFFDNIITAIFVIEIAIKMMAEKRTLDFFKNGWNVFDFIIVTVSLIPIDQTDAATLGRLLRIFRLLRMISIIPELKILMGSLVKSLKPLGYVALLMFIIFYIYASVGSIYFEKINPNLWGDIAISMLTLFRIMTFEDWTDVMYETMEVYPLSWIYHISFIFFTAFTFLNMMIGIIVEVMDQERQKVEIEEGEGEAAEVHEIKEQMNELDRKLTLLLEKEQKNT